MEIIKASQLRIKTDDIPFIKCLRVPRLEVGALYSQAMLITFTERQGHTGSITVWRKELLTWHRITAFEHWLHHH